MEYLLFIALLLNSFSVVASSHVKKMVDKFERSSSSDDDSVGPSESIENIQRFRPSKINSTLKGKFENSLDKDSAVDIKKEAKEKKKELLYKLITKYRERNDFINKSLYELYEGKAFDADSGALKKKMDAITDQQSKLERLLYSDKFDSESLEFFADLKKKSIQGKLEEKRDLNAIARKFKKPELY